MLRTQVITKLTAVLLILAAFGLSAPVSTARQTAAAPTTAKAATTKKARPVRKRRVRPRPQTAPTAARISEIQSALAAKGAYKGQPNGKWDNATMQAVRDFQSSHGLTATGKLDALTLQKLGLGSEIAGRAAPLPLTQTPAAAGTTQQQTP
jgi:peptidoglycan hydrolase-like protein with peptidoglycan-binding domain